MSLETVLVCPLGAECEEARDGKLYRCRWYTKMRGRDATGEQHDSWDCAITWLPVLQTEASGTNRNVAAAINSLRNEQTVRQDLAIEEMRAANAKAITSE